MDIRVPLFHVELGNILKMPTWFPNGWQKYLESANEHARMYKSYQLIITDECIFKENIMALLFRRFGGLNESCLKWWADSQFGDVLPNQSSTKVQASSKNGGMEASIRSWSDTHAKKEILTLGTTHITVNFIDLSFLLFSAIYDAEDIDDDDIDLSTMQGPLRVVCYSPDCYNIAKTLVLVEMMSNGVGGGVSGGMNIIDSVIQCWYSSTWSLDTLALFRSCVDRCISKFNLLKKSFLSPTTNDDEGGESKILAYLKLWSITDVSVTHAYKTWLRYTTYYFADIANYSNVNDRVAVAKYKLSGELLVGHVGSTMMFAGFFGRPRSLNECFYEGLPVDIHIRYEANENVISTYIDLLRDRIRGLQTLLLQHQIQISVRYGSVTPESAAIVRQMNPYTILWTGIPADLVLFHETAHLCSTSQTVHYGVTVQWGKQVKGVSIVDYTVARQRVRMMDCALQTLENLSLQTGPHSSGVVTSHIALSPFFQCEHCLGSLYYKQYVNHFQKLATQAMTARGQANGTVSAGSVQPNRGNGGIGIYTSLSPFFVLSRHPSLMYLTWTYNESIKFQHQ